MIRDSSTISSENVGLLVFRIWPLSSNVPYNPRWLLNLHTMPSEKRPSSVSHPTLRWMEAWKIIL